MNKKDSVPENDQIQDEKFESDTQKLVRQHMEDKDHNISEDDMRNVRIGMSPPTEASGKNTGEIAEALESKKKNDGGYGV